MGIQEYTEFNKSMSSFFASVAESTVIRRRTPKHEVIFPHYIKENMGDQTIKHLLILGAEVKSKQLGMGYGAKTGEDAFAFTSYFVYGCEAAKPEFGKAVDTRNAMGAKFQIFDSASEAVCKQAHKLYKIVMEEKG